jgi:hypothetical protein
VRRHALALGDARRARVAAECCRDDGGGKAAAENPADFRAAVERLTGRKVLAFISGNHMEPDIAAELFTILDARFEPEPAQPAAICSPRAAVAAAGDAPALRHRRWPQRSHAESPCSASGTT